MFSWLFCVFTEGVLKCKTYNRVLNCAQTRPIWQCEEYLNMLKEHHQTHKYDNTLVAARASTSARRE
jgi:hypothetical protein